MDDVDNLEAEVRQRVVAMIRRTVEEYLSLQEAAARGEIIHGKTARSQCCRKVLVIGQFFDGSICKRCIEALPEKKVTVADDHD